MLKSVKSRGEEAFAKFLRHQEKKARKEKEKARQERAHVAHLRGLRLAKGMAQVAHENKPRYILQENAAKTARRGIWK